MDLTCPIKNIAPLVPHSGRMVLLDEIVAFGSDFVEARSSIRDDHCLLQREVLPILMGLEIMAQGVAAFAGIQDVLANQPIRLGFLLGTRKLHIHIKELPIGSKLAIDAKLSTQDATGMGVFDCQLRWLNAPDSIRQALTDDIILQAALNVYSPKTVQAA